MNAAALAPAATTDRKELLRIVVVGSVDDGKSTLIGRLLYECGGLYADQIAAVKKATKAGAAGEEDIDFSLFTDGLKAEREQGITIDVAYRYLTTGRRALILADTPGHVQYTRNMATGASTADAAVILIDAALGVLPQTRRHAYIASLLGIPYLAVAVNKMDRVDFDRAVFERIGEELQAFATGLGFSEIRLFPVSARLGANVTRPSPRTPWFAGGTLLGWLESLPHASRLSAAPLRLPVQTVLRPDADYRGFAGQIASGSLKAGDEIVALPSGRRARVRSIDTFDGPLAEAAAPASVAVRLDAEIDVGRGEVLAVPSSPPRVTEDLDAHLVWMSEVPLDTGRRYLLKCGARTVPARVDRVLGRTDLESLAEVSEETLLLNDIGRVHVITSRPLVCDTYAENRRTGAFILIDPRTNDTLAAGMIAAIRERPSRPRALSLVRPDERQARLGQRGIVAVVPPGLEELGAVLERRLFDEGLHVALVQDAEVAQHLAQAGLVAILAGPSSGLDEPLRLSGDDLETWLERILPWVARMEVRS